ncbi:hypothetical protein C8J56DRAFT_1025320 [Mycena floridula]|nr:hypothetical protein C8J56DRAFT_1025320 [Mycena floridula]
MLAFHSDSPADSFQEISYKSLASIVQSSHTHLSLSPSPPLPRRLFLLPWTLLIYEDYPAFVSIGSRCLPRDFGGRKSGILSLFSARVRSFFVSPSLCPFYITAILSHKRHSDDLDQIIYLTRNDATCVRMDFAFLCAGRYVPKAASKTNDAMTGHFRPPQSSSEEYLKSGEILRFPESVYKIFGAPLISGNLRRAPTSSEPIFTGHEKVMVVMAGI